MANREDIESGNVWPNDEDDYVPSDLEFLLAASLIDQGILQEAILDAIEGAVIVEWRARRQHAYMRSLRAMDRGQWADRGGRPRAGDDVLRASAGRHAATLWGSRAVTTPPGSSAAKSDAVAVIVSELAEWDDEFDTPKWAPHTRQRMAEAIYRELAEAGHFTSSKSQVKEEN